jgi:hypothetical protein
MAATWLAVGVAFALTTELYFSEYEHPGVSYGPVRNSTPLAVLLALLGVAGYLAGALSPGNWLVWKPNCEPEVCLAAREMTRFGRDWRAGHAGGDQSARHAA